ncbi:MAG: hypothetical protein Q4B54_07505 [Coriobacteriales bacterium]|nr:hypothetical protein [Coriobacteriales bacterium]
MHSNKIIKVLGAGLTAAALTLGAMAPAFAEVKIGSATQSGKEVLTNQGDQAIVDIPITKYSTDNGTMPITFNGYTLFYTDVNGKTGENTFEAVSVDSRFYQADGFEADPLSDKVDHLRILFQNWDLDGSDAGNKTFPNGTYELKYAILSDADSIDDFNISGIKFKIEGSDTPSPLQKVGADLSTLTASRETVDLAKKETVKIFVNVATDAGWDIPTGMTHQGTKKAPTVTFTYISPSGTEFEVDARCDEVAGKGEYKTFSKELGWETNFVDETGTYQLSKIRVYDDETGSVAYYTEGLEAGNFSIINGTADKILRVYNPNSGEHFYTKSTGEKDALVKAGWIFEGVAFLTAKADTADSVEVFRAYNPNGGDHHFTTSKGEMDLLVTAGWKNEGVAFYGLGTTKGENNKRIFRLYNPNALTGSHHYTTSEGEKNLLVDVGWNDEGTAWYAPLTV